MPGPHLGDLLLGPVSRRSFQHINENQGHLSACCHVQAMLLAVSRAAGLSLPPGLCTLGVEAGRQHCPAGRSVQRHTLRRTLGRGWPGAPSAGAHIGSIWGLPPWSENSRLIGPLRLHLV